MTAQALPDQYPNLAQLFQAAPLMGFAQAGDMQAIADQNNPRLQQAFDTQQAQQKVMNPLLAAYQGAETDHLNASSGALRSQTAGTDLANAFSGATQPGKIASTNAGNSLAATKDTADQMEEQGRIFGQVAGQLKALPDDATPWERANLVKQAMGAEAAKYPGLDKILVDNHGDLADKLDAMSQNSYEKSKEARKAKAAEEMWTNRIQLQGENALALQAMKGSQRMELSELSFRLKPKSQENMSQWEARMNNEAQAGSVQAQQAVQQYHEYQVAKGSASAEVNDQFRRALLSGQSVAPKPTAPALPPTQPVSTPPVASQAPPQGSPGRPMVDVNAGMAGRLETLHQEQQKFANQPEVLNGLNNEISALVKQFSSKLPPGSKYNNDGTFTMPDGRIVRPK